MFLFLNLFQSSSSSIICSFLDSICSFFYTRYFSILCFVLSENEVLLFLDSLEFWVYFSNVVGKFVVFL
jgi:hypothetical protein